MTHRFGLTPETAEVDPVLFALLTAAFVAISHERDEPLTVEQATEKVANMKSLPGEFYFQLLNLSRRLNSLIRSDQQAAMIRMISSSLKQASQLPVTATVDGQSALLKMHKALSQMNREDWSQRPERGFDHDDY